jgi:hypothetical protein
LKTTRTGSYSVPVIELAPSPDGKEKVIGSWLGLDEVHQATGKTFEVEFCTVARWKNGETVEANLFDDQLGFLRQIGVL